MKKLGVIILNWNGLQLLQRFLPTAIRYTSAPEVELVVADNGSTDSSVAWLRANCPTVRVIELGSNLGFAAGYNRAIELTSYPFTVLLNSDVKVTKDWWQPLLQFLETHPNAAAVQPKIRSLRNPACFEHAGAAGGYLDALGYPYCRGRLFDAVEKDTGQYDGPPVQVAWASGACLAVRTQAYRDTGGLDADFFAHMEEIDLCCRMQAQGWTVWALTDSTVYHLGGASLPYGDARKTYLNFRNNLLLLHKNSPDTTRRRRLLLRRLADTLAWAAYMARADWKNARAVLKAHRDFRRMAPRYTSHPDTDFLPTLPGAHRHAVWDRYVRRLKK